MLWWFIIECLNVPEGGMCDIARKYGMIKIDAV